MPLANLIVAAPHLTSQWRREYLHRLKQWFAKHQRDLPWRHTHDAYSIWISETMLQQTQVATVIDYYVRFLKRFPTVADLAAAPEQEVLGLWAGLGYYRRARQLHAAAQQVVEELDAQFPTDLQQLLKLPGIGRYTAGAIASIAGDHPAPILEANTERLFARLLKWEKPTRDRESLELLWQFAEWQLPKRAGGGARILNQAAMELGSLICKPLNPQCSACPLRTLCPTAALGLQQSIPAPKPKKQFTPLNHVAFIIEHAGHWLIRRNPDGAWWAGLWDFPRIDITQPLPAQAASTSKTKVATATALHPHSLAQLAKQELGLDLKSLEHGWQFRHGVTRYRITVDCWHAEWQPATGHSQRAQCDLRVPDRLPKSQSSDAAQSQWLWLSPEHAHHTPLTAPAKKILLAIQAKSSERA